MCNLETVSKYKNQGLYLQNQVGTQVVRRTGKQIILSIYLSLHLNLKGALWGFPANKNIYIQCYKPKHSVCILELSVELIFYEWVPI